MKLLLSLKSWQIFIIIWGIPILTSFIPIESMNSSLLIILTIIWGLFLFIWIYSIGKYLPEKLNSEISISSKLFHIHIWYLIGVGIIISFMAPYKDYLEQFAFILPIIFLYYFVAVFMVFRYVSKIIASLELNKLAKFSDYIGYILLFWFSPIGIWIIQPKVRKYFVK